MSPIAFSTLSKLFLFKVRSNYIAHIQLIYCVKLSNLLWCLNSRVIKNPSSLLSEAADPQVYAEGCIQARALKASLRCCTHWLSWAVQVTVVWHSRTTDPEVLGITFQIWSITGTSVVDITTISVETPSQAKDLSGCHKVFDIFPFS